MVDAPGQLKLDTIKEFEKECGTKIEPEFPIFLVFVDSELKAYYYVSQSVVIWPTVHPGKMNPRAFYEMAKTVVAGTKRVFGNPLWMNEPSSQLDNPDLMRKVGLSRCPLSVYKVF
jgi:hypothetical protein